MTEAVPNLRKALDSSPTVATVAVDRSRGDVIAMRTRAVADIISVRWFVKNQVMSASGLPWSHRSPRVCVLLIGSAVAPPLSATMLAILLMTLSSATALVFIYFFLPALWRSLMIVDETLDAHEAGFTLVASRACFLNSNVSPFSFLATR